MRTCTGGEKGILVEHEGTVHVIYIRIKLRVFPFLSVDVIVLWLHKGVPGQSLQIMGRRVHVDYLGLVLGEVRGLQRPLVC